jgi:putative ABC transport system ATP-binding protein
MRMVEKTANQAQIVQLLQVRKTFKTASGEYQALKGIDLTINKGEFVAVVGKSGSGKSTLMNMITGIDHPTSGEVIVDGTNIYKMNESQRALWRGRNLGIVFQFFQLMPMLTLLENTMLPMDYCNVYPASERQERALALLQQVGLQDQAHKLPLAVSSGQQQSAAIARALATDPPILIADEPTGNLDSRSAEVIIWLFDQLVDQGKTIIMVTHDPSMTERTSRTLIISDGEMINETIARALPLLSHSQMREVSHLVEMRSYLPGSTILEKGQSQDYFYMISRGMVEVVLQTRRCPELVVARLGEGNFFGEVELMRGGNSIASIRTANGSGTELLALPRNAFLNLLKGSPLTEQAISKVVQKRVEQNRVSEKQCNGGMIFN